MQKIKILIIATIILLCNGCVSWHKQEQILTTYSYEGVYDKNVDIKINDISINRQNKERIWILSDRTLSYLIAQGK